MAGWAACGNAADMSSSILYLSNASSTGNHHLEGPARWVRHRGRRGLNATSIHTRIAFPEHTLAGERGSAALWFMPMEDLNSTQEKETFSLHLKSWREYRFLIDSPDFEDDHASRFCVE